MSINFSQLILLLKGTNHKVYRDQAPEKEKLPYIVYSFISEGKKNASGAIYRRLPLYQVSLFTKETEKSFLPITEKLNSTKVPFSEVSFIQGSENDQSINHYFITVRCIDD